MASVEECAQALQDLADRLAGVDGDLRRRHIPSRTLACTVTDLDLTFVGRLDEHGIHDITTGSPGDGQVRLSCSSDDLLALVAGSLTLPAAWTRGRLRIEASLRDLLRLRSLLG